MVQQSTLSVLRPYFSLSLVLPRFGAGAAVGVLAWVSGQSRLGSLALTLSTGFGALLILSLCATVVLALAARCLNSGIGGLAYAGFQRVLPWMHKKLLGSAAAFFGLVAVAGLCWLTTASANALLVAVFCSFLGGALCYCWVGLLVMARDLSARACLPRA